MDGAVKFTQRDAVAALIILAVNIVAGIIIGIVKYDLPVVQSMETFTLLTVGDGLVTAIPSLLISVGGAILTTRSGSTSPNLGTEVMGQLGVDSRPLAIAAAVLFLFGAVPGLPLVPFWVMGGIFGILAYATWKFARQRAAGQGRGRGQGQAQAAEGPEKVEALLKVDPLGLEVGYGLIPLLDASQGGTVLERIKALRRQMAQDLGIVVPPIRIRDNLQLPANTYRLLLRGEEIARSTVMPGHVPGHEPRHRHRRHPGHRPPPSRPSACPPSGSPKTSATTPSSWATPWWTAPPSSPPTSPNWSSSRPPNWSAGPRLSSSWTP